MTALPPPGPHGGDGVAVARALGLDPASILDLSLSLNPVAPDVTSIVARHLDALRRYPDATEATATLASRLDVDPHRVVLTNGGSEAIALVATEAGGGRVDEPDFSLYPRGGGPRWRSNPHSPTGLLASDDEGADVWDEAFWPLATGTWTRGDADRGAWIVGSLTKLLACPGLRVGYAIAPSVQAADGLRDQQPAWSVNGLATEALPTLLATVDLPGWRDQVDELRTALVVTLTAAGFRPAPSAACWVLVEAPDLRTRLAPHGVVVRDCASFGLPDHVRIAVPDTAGLIRLAHALEASS